MMTQKKTITTAFLALASALSMQYSSASGLGPQSGYDYCETQSASYVAPVCDWDINLTDPLEIIMPAVDQGIYLMSTNYTIEDHHYDVELFEYDCKTAPSGPTIFPIVFYDQENSADNVTKINDVHLTFLYNQTLVQESSFWTANKTGGTAKFCLRFNNYLSETPPISYYSVPEIEKYDLQVNFLEVLYEIQVDSLTDFEADPSIEIIRRNATKGGDEYINYEEDIEAFVCNDAYQPLADIVFTQGDYVNICVETVDGSAFEVHSIKDLVVSQWDAMASTPYVFSDFEYVADFVDSPLAESSCIDSNTTDAICKAKVQLIADWFDQTQIDASAGVLNVDGTVKLDYLGRRLSVDVPVNVRVGTGASNEASAEGSTLKSRDLENGSTLNFGVMLQIEGGEAAVSGTTSPGALFSAGVAFLMSLALF